MRQRFLLGFVIGQLALFGFAALALADTAYVVGAGDTLSALAQRFGVSVDGLVARNSLPSADQIYVGQSLSIPETGATSVGGASSPGGATARTGSHLVAAGETLGLIAARYGTTVDALVRANNLASPNLVWAGIRLVIPGAVSSAFDASAATVSADSDSDPDGAAAPRSIVIDLSDSRLYAYDGQAVAAAFAVSAGGPGTATPVGRFSIGRRFSRQDMSGPDYYAPDVPWVQYFTGNYAIHGTYWHNSFGEPVSHGCVNMRTPDAEWLYFWSAEGTPVEVRW